MNFAWGECDWVQGPVTTCLFPLGLGLDNSHYVFSIQELVNDYYKFSIQDEFAEQ